MLCPAGKSQALVYPMQCEAVTAVCRYANSPCSAQCVTAGHACELLPCLNLPGEQLSKKQGTPFGILDQAPKQKAVLRGIFHGRVSWHHTAIQNIQRQEGYPLTLDKAEFSICDNRMLGRRQISKIVQAALPFLIMLLSSSSWTRFMGKSALCMKSGPHSIHWATLIISHVTASWQSSSQLVKSDTAIDTEHMTFKQQAAELSLHAC